MVPVPVGSDRTDQIIRSASPLIPAQILAEFLGLNIQQLQRRRDKLGVRLTVTDARQITERFRRSLPEICDCSLSRTEIREIQILRHRWLQTRAENGYAKVVDQLRTFVRFLPTAVLARVVGRNHDGVLALLREELLLPTTAEQRRISRRFETATRPPIPERTGLRENIIITEEWNKARARRAERRQRIELRKRTVAESKLELMTCERDRLRRDDSSTEECLCTSSCGETWPRTSTFFTPSYRSSDKLSRQCWHCCFVLTQQRLAAGDARPRRVRSRILEPEEEARCAVIVRHLGDTIPGEIIAQLFDVSINTIYRIRVELEIRQTAQQSARIAERWQQYVQDQTIPAFEILSPVESSRLAIISRPWHNERRKVQLSKRVRKPSPPSPTTGKTGRNAG